MSDIFFMMASEALKAIGEDQQDATTDQKSLRVVESEVTNVKGITRWRASCPRRRGQDLLGDAKDKGSHLLVLIFPQISPCGCKKSAGQTYDRDLNRHNEGCHDLAIGLEEVRAIVWIVRLADVFCFAALWLL